MRILPQPDVLTEPYWEGARLGQLRLQHCVACAAVWHPPLPCCPACHGTAIEWRASSGRGTLYSFTVAHHPVHPAVVDEVPYLVALVDLDEGPRVISGLPGVPFDAVRIGMRLRVRFDDIGEGLRLPQFVPDGTVAAQPGDGRAGATTETP